MLKNQKLVFNFFYIFSRFEFALKATGFLYGDNSSVSAGWDKFAESIDRKYKLVQITSVQFHRSAKYLFDHPPQKQIKNKSNKLDWKEAGLVSSYDFKNLLLLVRRIRNNLFHGGKFISGSIKGSERDKFLIECSLIILKECLELNEEVKNKFEEERHYLIL